MEFKNKARRARDATFERPRRARGALVYLMSEFSMLPAKRASGKRTPTQPHMSRKRASGASNLGMKVVYRNVDFGIV